MEIQQKHKCAIIYILILKNFGHEILNAIAVEKLVK